MPRLTDDRFVARQKIEDYLLNPHHPKGGPKAAYFAAFGFARGKWETMSIAIADHPAWNDIVRTEEDDHGLKTIIECTIVTPDGRNPCIRTIWFRDRGQSLSRFVTATPVRRDASA